MFRDWQTIAVCLIILGALAYLGRRGWARARSFRAGAKGQAAASSSSSCASGCGSCGDERTAATTAKPQNSLVQITNAGRASTRQRTS